MNIREQLSSASFATPSMTRAERAEWIAAGCPSSVSYEGKGLPPHMFRTLPAPADERICKRWWVPAPSFGCECWVCEAARHDIEEAREQRLTQAGFPPMPDIGKCWRCKEVRGFCSCEIAYND